MSAEVWDSARAAEALGVTVRQFNEKVSHAPGFPPPLPIPGMRPHWSAKAIQAWIEKASATS